MQTLIAVLINIVLLDGLCVRCQVYLAHHWIAELAVSQKQGRAQLFTRSAFAFPVYSDDHSRAIAPHSSLLHTQGRDPSAGGKHGQEAHTRGAGEHHWTCVQHTLFA